ncbi:thioredoxin family protein [Enterococcus sp. AZ126]|uniref:thioredoxin family protein n=1 Tax=Enterococcus sp. AZ126 TaxID=2774635 RepID=UPI003F21F443
MIIPTSYEELASFVSEGKSVFFFTADWCGDCRFIKPVMPEIEAEFPEFRFIEVDRDKFMELASEWNIFGIPSFVVTNQGKELGRLVNKNRKTKEEITTFLKSIS